MWLSFQGLFLRRLFCSRISKNLVQQQNRLPGAVCVHTEYLTTSLPFTNTSLNSANVFPGCTHALSIIPLDHVTSYHFICLVYFKNIYLPLFRANSSLCNTRLSLLLRHRYSHHLRQEVSPGLSELPSCPNPSVLSTPDPRGNCPCYSRCWEAAGSQRGGRRGREGNCR